MEAAGLAKPGRRGGWYDLFRDRILFPIQDQAGRVVAFGGRIVGEGEPKYLNSPQTEIFDKGRVLFGFAAHREAIRRRGEALVVEGNFDLLQLAAHGFDYGVAPLGTALTREQVRLLARWCRGLVLLFDGDAAGLKAASRCVPHLLDAGLDARVAVLPEGHDPDSLLLEHGPEAMEEVLSGAVDLPEFTFEQLAREHGLGLSGKSRILAAVREMAAACRETANRRLLANFFAERLGVPPEELLAAGPSPAGDTVGRDREPSVEVAPDRGMSLWERQLADMLLTYPEHLEAMLAAGLEELLDSPWLRQLVELLAEVPVAKRHASALLADRLEDGPLRRYLTGLLAKAPMVPVENVEDGEAALCLEELLGWIGKQRERRRRTLLVQRLRQRCGDEETLQVLRHLGSAQGKQEKKEEDSGD